MVSNGCKKGWRCRVSQRNQGKEFALRFHLQTNFYPKHPKWVVDRFVKSFKKYWKHKDLEKLNKSLSDIYSCDWSRYGFYNFLNKGDLWDNTIN